MSCINIRKLPDLNVLQSVSCQPLPGQMLSHGVKVWNQLQFLCSLYFLIQEVRSLHFQFGFNQWSKSGFKKMIKKEKQRLLEY